MNKPHTLQLALQGGGAHGAFTWGVLERLLDCEAIDIRRVSGTSAGALNGAALVTGLMHGGRDGARRSLATLWQKAAEVGVLGSLLMLPLRKPSMGVWDDAMPIVAPVVANPLGIEPLRQVLNQVIDVAALNDSRAPQLFVNAVRVRDGATKVFGPGHLSIDAILASACAPQLFTAVGLDGESYWDGSYTANPVISPLYDRLSNTDILFVELTPPIQNDIPISAKNILNRLNEIASTVGVRAEMERLRAYCQEHPKVRFHLLSIPERSHSVLMDPSIKRSADIMVFQALRDEGTRCCNEWLDSNESNIGVNSTVDLSAIYRPQSEPC